MIFLELAGLVMFAIVVGVGAWHIFKYLASKDAKKEGDK